MWFGQRRQQQYQLVDQYGEKPSNIDSDNPRSNSFFTTSCVSYVPILIFSLFMNIVLLAGGHSSRCPPDHGRSTYSGLTFDDLTTFHSHNPYWDPNATLSSMNDAWDALNTDPMAISLHDSYVAHHDLQPSSRFPWDTEKSIYYVKGIHDLHCLKLIRHAIVSEHYGEAKDVEDGNEKRGISMHHLFHCLDNLRQDIQCYADDTPMPAPAVEHIGDQQTRQCRNWDKLVQWAEHEDRNACHSFDDYREATNTLELFAHCPEGSVYEEVVKGYFGVHGWKGAYAVEEGKEETVEGPFDDHF